MRESAVAHVRASDDKGSAPPVGILDRVDLDNRRTTVKVTRAALHHREGALTPSLDRGGRTSLRAAG
jgi:hypothetical protein